MSAESVLDEALTRLLGKAHQEMEANRENTDIRPISLNFEWSGGGSVLSLTRVDPIKLCVPIASQIATARLCAGNAAGKPVPVSTTIDVQVTSFLTFGASIPLHGTGTIPTLILTPTAECNLTGWKTNFILGDWLIAKPISFAGFATWVSFELVLRPSVVPIGVSTIVDNSGNTVVDSSGNTLVLRA